MNIFETILVQPLVNGLLVFYHLLFNDLGLAIIALTAAIRLIMLPITNPSMRAMQKMKELAPELAKLKERHKGDKTKLMQAQTDLYKQHGVNPAAGCIPQLVQIAVLFILLQVFNLIAYGNATENLNKFAYPSLHLSGDLNTHFLYLDLTKPDVLNVAGVPFPLPGVFLLVSALLQFLSSKMLAPEVSAEKKQAAKTSGELDDVMAATQQQMLYLFPLLTIFIGFSFASGLVLYWLALSLFQMIQQYYVSGWGGLTPWLRTLNLVK